MLAFRVLTRFWSGGPFKPPFGLSGAVLGDWLIRNVRRPEEAVRALPLLQS